MKDNRLDPSVVEIGEWIEVLGVKFQLTGLFLHHDKHPRVEFKHPTELMPALKIERPEHERQV